MQSDFLDAHHRHREDAEALFESQRWANADHLFGIAVECGLKRLMGAFGMQISSIGVPQKKQDKVHADGVWARYEAYRSGSPAGTGYGLSMADPFQDWDVSQRYAHQGEFSKAQVLPHRRGADKVLDLLRKAQRDGLI